MDDMPDDVIKWDVDSKLAREHREHRSKVDVKAKEIYLRFKRLLSNAKDGIKVSKMTKWLTNIRKELIETYESEDLNPPPMMVALLDNHIETFNNPVALSKAMTRQDLGTADNFILNQEGIGTAFKTQEELLKIPWVAKMLTPDHVGFLMEPFEMGCFLFVVDKVGAVEMVGQLKTMNGLSFPTISQWLEEIEKQ